MLATLLLLLQILGTIPANHCAEVVVSWACVQEEETPVEPPAFAGLQALPKNTEETVYEVEDRVGTFSQSLGALPAGAYSIVGTLTLDKVCEGVTKLCGYRVVVNGTPHPWTGGRVSTGIVSGTGTFAVDGLKTMPDPSRASVAVEAYGSPGGSVSASFQVVYSKPPPVTAFLKYPNYKGLLEGNEVVVNVSGPSVVTLETLSGKVLDTKESEGGDVTLDASGVVNWAWLRVRIGDYQHPLYAVQRGASRTDRFNRFYRDGKPYIPIGVYDSGLPYVDETDPRWPTMLEERRRLAELKPDIYLNYHYGIAPAGAMKGLAKAIAPAQYVQPANCFAQWCDSYSRDSLAIGAEEFVAEMSKLWWGVYLADEPHLVGVETTWDTSTYLRNYPGFVLGVHNRIGDLPAWRDSVDVQGVDPYPVFGDGSDLSMVAKWVAAARESVMDARPVIAALQFWRQNSQSRFPTQGELETMGLTAIAEGADGILFWSIGNGTRALFSGVVCGNVTEWCPERVELFERLKGAIATLHKVSAEPGVTVLDDARAKAVRKGESLIVYNKTAAAITATVEGQEVALGPFEARLF